MPKPIDSAAAEKLAAYLAGRRDLKRIERSNAGKVLRRFAKQLLPLEYRRKSTFFAREAGHLIQFLHLHKFSFGPNFRMHVCIRVLNETRDWVALSGITSDEYARYHRTFIFEDDEASMNQCATQMMAFVTDVAEPWFSRWHEQALIGPHSPIPEDAQDALVQARAGNGDPAKIDRSRTLLGLRPRATASDSQR
jgi:hypothetical protein